MKVEGRMRGMRGELTMDDETRHVSRKISPSSGALFEKWTWMVFFRAKPCAVIPSIFLAVS